MVVYETCDIYIQSATTLKGKIAKIDNLIIALEDAALKAANNAHISEYSLDDGQSKIMTGYRSLTDIIKAMQAFQTVRTMYVNRLNGYVMTLVDQSNFRRRWYGNSR